MALACAHCGAALDGLSVDRARGLASCKACGAETELSAPPPPEPEPEPRPAPRALARPAPPPRPPAALPKGMTVAEEPGALLLSWRWFSWQKVISLAISLVWAAFVLRGISKDSSFSLLMGAFGAVFVYSSIAGVLNRTVTEARNDALRIRHGPLPWLGGGTYPASSLQQLYVEKKEKTDSEGGVTVTYVLTARFKDGRRRELVKLESPETALYLEQALERRYRIKDEPVLGEFTR